ncbi:ECF RNA polymerase sigma factor SigW [compost metagenome]
MKTSQFTDTELVGLLNKGDHNAYTEIFNRYFKLMFVFAYKKLTDEELAKDMVQELFVKLWERRESLNTTSNFTAYLYVALRNKILDYYSHQQVRNRYANFLEKYMLNSKAEDADHRIRERQLADYIETQIQSLPKKMRLIFEMSRKEHLSHKEIATVLETSENNVSTQIMNAIRILKVKLGTTSLLFFLT